MSLINDMLRDLDARRSQPAGGSLSARPCTGTGGMETGITGTGVAWALAGICLFSVIAVSTPLFTGLLADNAADESAAPAITVENAPAGGMDEPVRIAGNIADPEVETAPAPEDMEHRRDSRSRDSRSRNDTDAPGTPDAPDLHDNMKSGEQSHAGITLLASTSMQQRAKAYRDAAAMAAAGHYLDAIDQLENILLRNNHSHEARLLLANLYIRQGRSANAESLLAGGLAQHPLHAPYARRLAHLLLTEERYREAVEYLVSALPGANHDAEYHALLAGLYQRSGEPAAAAAHYNIALDISPGRGEWWMGLGISQEQAGQGDAAHSAYRQALQFPLAAALQDYINNRLQRLADDVSLNKITWQLPGKD